MSGCRYRLGGLGLESKAITRDFPGGEERILS